MNKTAEELVEETKQQTSLLNLETKELNPYWVDPSQPLIIPVNPLHYKLHELQILKEILKRQAVKNPAQFNSGNYIKILDECERVATLINEGKTHDDRVDAREVDSERAGRSKAPPMGNGAPAGMGAGVSADNPFAG